MSSLCASSNSTTNATDDGELFVDLEFLATPNLVYAIIQLLFIPFILAGNFLVVASICVFRRLRNTTHALLASLAVADFLVGVWTIPLYVAFYLRPETLLCHRVACLTWFSSVIFSCGVSLVNLTVIVLDRFLAIHFPYMYSKHRTAKKVAAVLAFTWGYVTFLCVLPLLGWNKWVDGEPCNFYRTLPKAYVAYTVYVTIFVCTAVPSVLYLKIFSTVIRQKRLIAAQAMAGGATGSAGGHNRRWMEKEVRSTRLTAALFLLFMAFWMPYFLLSPLKYSSLSQEVVDIIKNAALILAFANSLINPIAYCFLQKKFRAAYKLLLTTPIWRWSQLSGSILVAEQVMPSLTVSDVP
jgi:hypothetical protein